MKRVVITGLGAVTPVGSGKQKFWDAIKNGVCGIDTITRFDASGIDCQIAAEVKDFEPSEYIDKKEARRMDRFVQYGIAATKMAVADSGIDFNAENLDRVGVITGSAVGGMETLEEQCGVLAAKGAGRVSPFFVPMMISNIAAAHIAMVTGARGINENITTACASGNNAIGDAFRHIQEGRYDIMVSGGCEAPITPLAYAGFSSMKAVSTRNGEAKTACSPFDANRDGFVMGEGAGIVILEELEHAKARGATIYCEVVGYGATDDAYHITAPHPEGIGAIKSMQNALDDAGVEPCVVNYINAHGTSTPLNDKGETASIKAVFGDHAYKLAVSSTKSMTGHLMGAAGGIEAVITALAVHDDFMPATINYTTPDPDCDLDYVVNKGRAGVVNYALSNSFGFGGHNATLLLKKYK